jgi:peptidoglycan glycosyltransferase
MDREMARRTSLLALATVVAFAFIALWLGYWQVAVPANRHAIEYAQSVFEHERGTERGRILDRAGRLLAYSQRRDDHVVRVYPSGAEIAPLLGYFSQRYGRTGIEFALDRELAPSGAPRTWREMIQALRGEPRPGHDVVLTIDSRLQEIAYRALDGRVGAVAALQPATGEVLALVSRPSFNPAGVDTGFEELRRARPPRLVERATQGWYPPGSAFKVVTAVAALDSGVVTPKTGYRCPGSVAIDHYQVHCFGGQAHGGLTFARALEVSCNVTFAQVAVAVGAERLARYASRFGLGRRLDLAIPVRVSRLARDRSHLTRTVLAQTGFGQGEVAVTPLQMAMVAAAVANRGKLVMPRLARQVQSRDGAAIERMGRGRTVTVARPATMAAVTEMMLGVVRRGTGTRARVSGLSVAGKTGTAENPRGRDHAWFICFAPAEHPEIALAVVVEHGGQGGRVAAPIARQILSEWTKRG